MASAATVALMVACASFEKPIQQEMPRGVVEPQQKINRKKFILIYFGTQAAGYDGEATTEGEALFSVFSEMVVGDP